MAHRFKFLLVPSVLIIFGLSVYPAQAAKKPPPTYPNITFKGTLRTQFLTEDNMDLGTGATDFEDSELIEAKIQATANLTSHTKTFSEVRGVLNYGAGGGEDPVTGEPLGREDFAELRQLWIEESNLFGPTPLKLKVGRQRFSEPYGLWWNRDLDALRLTHETAVFKGFVGVGENLASYRTSGEDFNKNDEDIFRFLAEGSWELKEKQFLEARLAWQDDHSDMENPGTIVSIDNRDPDDAKLLWAGIRLKGETAAFFNVGKNITYRVDLAGVAGDEDSQTSTAGPSATQRTITGSADTDVRGWALDADVQIPLGAASKSVMLLGYAYGSGDDNPADGTDHAFRQTGMDSNSGYYGVSSSAVNHYGFVLRPDLSNIHIFTAGVSSPVMTGSDLTFLYHYYRLADETAALSTSSINAPLNNQDTDLGHEADLMLNVGLAKELGINAAPLRSVDWKTTVGIFRAGEAYGTAGEEIATRARMELVFRF